MLTAESLAYEIGLPWGGDLNSLTFLKGHMSEGTQENVRAMLFCALHETKLYLRQLGANSPGTKAETGKKYKKLQHAKMLTLNVLLV